MNCWPEPEVSSNLNREELGNLGLTEKEEEAIVAFMNPMKNNPDWMSRFLNPGGG